MQTIRPWELNYNDIENINYNDIENIMHLNIDNINKQK